MSEVLQLTTHTKNKSVLLTPELETALPGVADAFALADAAFEGHEEEYLQNLEESQFMVRSQNGPEVACSLIMNRGQQSEDLMLIFAPFADRSPNSSAKTMYEYISGNSVSKTAAKPNTWNQTTKSAVTADVLEALGHGMPVLTIYAPVPQGAYSAFELELFKQGNFTPAGQMALSAIEMAQQRVHGKQSPLQFTNLHISGASLGASNAIGAASKLLQEDYNVKSVTAQELVLSPENGWDLAKRFMTPSIGEASEEAFPEDARVIAEAALRRAIDHKGSEIIGMNLRMGQGASKTKYMAGLTHPEPTLRGVRHLQRAGVDLLFATANNSPMSDKTRTLLPTEVQQVHIAAQQGEKLGHIVDEHVTLSALVIALNIFRSR